MPKVPSSNAALMVALLLHHVPGTPGMAKERLMVLAEETGVSKESSEHPRTIYLVANVFRSSHVSVLLSPSIAVSGDGGFYDGWSGIKQLQEGDPALVRKEKVRRTPPSAFAFLTVHF